MIKVSNLEKIRKILKLGSSEEKIKILESLSCTDDLENIQEIIARLDDVDIKVRGEAFSSLVLNENKISDILIKNLRSENKNIRGSLSLVLANRNDTNAIKEIIKLTHDQHSMVRECAVGALGHLKAKEAKESICNCLFDANMEVRKSAVQAAINIGYSLSENEFNEISLKKDFELEEMLEKIKRKSGPKGI